MREIWDKEIDLQRAKGMVKVEVTSIWAPAYILYGGQDQKGPPHGVICSKKAPYFSGHC